VARLKGSSPGPVRIATATSAGGVVVRIADGARQIVLGRRRRSRDGVTWVLPKGTVEAGESVDQTALREVREETGLEVRSLEPIGSIEYDFGREGTRIHKTVHFFLMEPVGGDLALHDHEFDAVRWVALDDAPGIMSHETERSVVSRALPGIERRWPVSGSRP
jgi:8-oxo-dGTP pyrophosphatase MutT (NUDIX family)